MSRESDYEVDALVSARGAAMKAELKAHAGDYDWMVQHGYLEQWNLDWFKQYGTWVGGEPKYSKAMAYKAVEREIRALSPFAKADLSDIMEGATREKIQVGWGHGNKYWKNGDWTLATEAFAEMYDSTVANPESLETIKKYLPKSYDSLNFEPVLKQIKEGDTDIVYATEKAMNGEQRFDLFLSSLYEGRIVFAVFGSNIYGAISRIIRPCKYKDIICVVIHRCKPRNN